MVKIGPVVLWIACFGLVWSYRWSFRSDRAFSEAFLILSPKGLENALSLLKDHVKLPIRPKQAIQMTTGLLLDQTKKDLKSFGLQIKKNSS